MYLAHHELESNVIIVVSVHEHSQICTFICWLTCLDEVVAMSTLFQDDILKLCIHEIILAQTCFEKTRRTVAQFITALKYVCKYALMNT